MNALGMLILAFLLRKKYLNVGHKPQGRPLQKMPGRSRLSGPHFPSGDNRPLAKTGYSGYRDLGNTLSEEGIQASLKLLAHYQTLNESQRKVLEGKMAPPVKAQYLHLVNSVWQMTPFQQEEYIRQQSKNGLYGQVGIFALRYYS